MSKFEIITTATEPSAKWSNIEVAKFHYLNPNGLYWKKMAIDDRISDSVAAGKATVDAFWAYGSFQDYSVNKLANIAMQKRVHRIQLGVVLDGLKEDIERAESFLETLA